MATNTVEQIFVELLLDAKGYSKGADDAAKKSEKLESGLKDVEKQSESTGEKLDNLTKGITKTLKGIAGLAAIIAAGTGLLRLADEARKANDELNFLSQNLGMSADNLKAWQGAAAALGGSAQGMTNDMKSLNKSMNDFVIKGDTSLLPYFNALGVSMVDAQGKIKDTDAVMLDLADSMSKMNREQAFALGQDLGFDEGTINTLLQGRDAMKQMVDYHKQMYTSNKQDLENSRKLSENQAKMSAHWQSMKLMLGNAVIPLLIKLSEVALRFFEFLQKHQKTVKNVFEGMAIILGVLLVPILSKALIALLAFIAPFAPFILVVGSLGAAFVALYDDYKTWAEGGNSLFNWGAFRKYIDDSTLSTDNLRNAFSNLAKELLSSAIPTLKGYADIISKLMSGDFRGAGALAWQMTKNLGSNVAGFVDDLTGQEQGALVGAAKGIVNRGSTGASTSKQAYSSKAFTKEKAASIARVAKNIGVDPNDLAAVISFETAGTFDPSIKNKNSTATGLIQFMRGTGGVKGKYYGMSRDKFASLSFDEQMKYVERYYKERSNRFRAGNEANNTTGDVYGAVTGWGYKRGSDAYNLNKVWDSNRNGIIEKGEMVQNPKFRAHQRNYFDSIAIGATQAQSTMPRNAIPATLARPQNSSMTNIDVKIGDIKVNTTASTITGVTSDATKAATNNIMQLTQPMH